MRKAYERLFGALGDTKEHIERRERILAVVYDGVPLGDHPVRFRAGDDTLIDYEKAFGEAISVAHLLVGSGLDRSAIEMQTEEPPLPDISLLLADGSRAYVEVCRVAESASARYYGTIQSINTELRRKERADKAYRSAIKGRFFSVVLPTAPTKKRDIPRCADEIVALFLTMDYDKVPRMRFQPVPDTYPTLHGLNALYVLGDRVCTYVRADNDAHSFNPNQPRFDLRAAIAQNSAKVYPVSDVWLALPLADPGQVDHLSMSRIREHAESIPVLPFRRLLIGTSEDAIVLDAPDFNSSTT